MFKKSSPSTCFWTLRKRWQSEQKYRDLEKKLAEQAIEASVSNFTTSTPPAQKRATERIIEVPWHLPAGTVAASDFTAKHGIKYEDLKNYMRRGIYGEKLDITEIPHPSRKGYMQKFLTPEQQEAAIDLLRRHGKLKDIPTTDTEK